MHTNQDGVARGINPIDYPPSTYTEIMKTVGRARRWMPAASTRRSAARAATLSAIGLGLLAALSFGYAAAIVFGLI